jgi:NAD(P)-dependent dehydrogenase (short-subunit alcohol dehydrogenase family)
MTGINSLFDLDGRVAVVTGGNGGIGRAISLGLARAGASVAVLARNDEKNRLVLAELQSIGRPALVSRLDVTDRAALGPAVEQNTYWRYRHTREQRRRRCADWRGAQ